MKELINIIVQKTGISEENAQEAVQVTLGFLKAKLPTPLAAQLDSFLSTRTTSPMNPVNPVAVGANA
jgi:nucleoid DNA-binding protein